jgi:hypothetical protein
MNDNIQEMHIYNMNIANHLFCYTRNNPQVYRKATPGELCGPLCAIKHPEIAYISNNPHCSEFSEISKNLSAILRNERGDDSEENIDIKNSEEINESLSAILRNYDSEEINERGDDSEENIEIENSEEINESQSQSVIEIEIGNNRALITR